MIYDGDYSLKTGTDSFSFGWNGNEEEKVRLGFNEEDEVCVRKVYNMGSCAKQLKGTHDRFKKNMMKTFKTISTMPQIIIHC